MEFLRFYEQEGQLKRYITYNGKDKIERIIKLLEDSAKQKNYYSFF